MNFVNRAVTGAILVNGAERTQPAVRVGEKWPRRYLKRPQRSLNERARIIPELPASRWGFWQSRPFVAVERSGAEVKR